VTSNELQITGIFHGLKCNARKDHNAVTYGQNAIVFI